MLRNHLRPDEGRCEVACRLSELEIERTIEKERDK